MKSKNLFAMTAIVAVCGLAREVHATSPTKVVEGAEAAARFITGKAAAVEGVAAEELVSNTVRRSSRFWGDVRFSGLWKNMEAKVYEVTGRSEPMLKAVVRTDQPITTVYTRNLGGRTRVTGIEGAGYDKKITTGSIKFTRQTELERLSTPGKSVYYEAAEEIDLDNRAIPTTRALSFGKIERQQYNGVDRNAYRSGETIDRFDISPGLHKRVDGILRETEGLGFTVYRGGNIDDMVSVDLSKYSTLPNDKVVRILEARGTDFKNGRASFSVLTEKGQEIHVVYEIDFTKPTAASHLISAEKMPPNPEWATLLFPDNPLNGTKSGVEKTKLPIGAPMLTPEKAIAVD
jgi:hypothetical protein